ncbi:MFS transporter [Actinacidiphila rubida]|uniref:MFS transporter n=1 Tax=Actinacidiphila rubida TaxID=310780 RepID=UPI00099F4854|nr:MFS transporter [Actinacidiphila rubida]
MTSKTNGRTPDPRAQAPTSDAPQAAAGARRWAVLAICCVAAALLGIDNSVLNYAVPSLARRLHPSSTQLLWIVDVYGFVLGGLLIVAGNLGDRIGRKKLLLAGVAGFGAASALTAYAGSPETLIAARALLGLAGATIMPSTLSLVRAAFTDPRERTTAIGVSSGVAAASFALGPVVGGLLLDHFWWGSVFLINVPVMALVLVAGVLVLPESRNPRPGRLDWASVPLSVAGLFGVIYAIKTAARDGAGSHAVWIAAAVGAVSLAAFFRRQTRIAEPLLELRLFRNATIALTSLASLFVGVAMFAGTVFLSQYFQLARGETPTMSGVLTIPLIVGLFLASMFSGRIITRTGRWKGFLVAGGLLVTAGAATLGMIRADTPYAEVAVYMALLGLGIGMMMQNLVLAVQNQVSVADLGAASSLVTFFRSLGGAIGVTALGAILGNRVTHFVTQGLAALHVKNAAGADGGIPDVATLPAPIRGVVENAYGHGVGDVFLYAAPFALIAFVLVLFIKEVALNNRSGLQQTPAGTGRSAVDAVEPAAREK